MNHYNRYRTTAGVLLYTLSICLMSPLGLAKQKATVSQKSIHREIATWIKRGQRVIGQSVLTEVEPLLAPSHNKTEQEGQALIKVLQASHSRVASEKKRQRHNPNAYYQPVDTTLLPKEILPPKKQEKTFSAYASKQNRYQAIGLLHTITSIRGDLHPNKNSPSIFLGQAMPCHRLAHIPIFKSCCAQPMSRAVLLLNQCPRSAYLLATARKEGRAHFVGHYCIKRASLLLGKICIIQANTYCVFSSKLARIIQEAAHQQIQDMFHLKSSEDQNTTMSSVAWPVHSLAGRWYRLPTAPTAVAAWSNPNDYSPTSVFFAICDRGHQCGSLPLLTLDELEVSTGYTFNGWTIKQLNLSEPEWTLGLNQVWLKGICPTAKNNLSPSKLCQWEIKQVGQPGYPDVLTDEIQWRLFPVDALLDGSTPAKTAPHYSDVLITTGTGIQIKPFLYHDRTILEKTQQVRLKIRLPKQSWQTITLPIIANQSANRILKTSPKIKVWGGCQLSTGLCHYWLAIRIPIKPLDWGSAQHPNCRGLNPSELLLINWHHVRIPLNKH